MDRYLQQESQSLLDGSGKGKIRIRTCRDDQGLAAGQSVQFTAAP